MPPDDRRKGLSLRGWLLVVSILSLLPLLGFAVYVALSLTNAEHDAELQRLARQAELLANAAEARVEAAAGVAETLSLYLSLPGGTVEVAYGVAARMVGRHFGIAGVSLADRTGQLLFATSAPLGMDLPRTQALEATERVFRTGRRQVSDLFTGALTGDQLITVHVPVRGPAGEVIRDLRIAYYAESFYSVLEFQPLPPGWVASIMDSQGVVVSRSEEGERWIGRPGPFDMDVNGSDADLWRVTVDGVPNVGAVARTAFGWTVAVRVEEDELLAPARRTMAAVFGTGVALLGLGVGAAWMLARRLAVRVARVTEAVTGLGRGQEVTVLPSGVQELDACSGALSDSRVLLMRREAEVRHSRDVLANVLATLPVGVWIINEQGIIVEGNAEGRRIWGGARFVGMNEFDQYKGWWHGTGQRLGKDDWAAARAIRHGETSLNEEIDIEGFDGSRRTISASAVPLRDADGRIRGAVVVNEDITARKASEAELLAAKETAERAVQAKSRFLATTSHDLRQPVQSLMLLVGTLATVLQDHPARRVADHMGRAIQALKTLLDGLLDLSRLDAQTVRPESEEFALMPLLDQLVAEYRPRAEQKGLRLGVVRTSAVLRSDPAMLGRILRNLLENAVKYTRAGRILVGVRHRGGETWVEVYDTGIGIPADQRAEIFQEFHQVGNPAHDLAQGLGLGLSIVQRLAVLLGARVVVRSVEGRGSAFAVVFPPPPPGNAVE